MSVIGWRDQRKPTVEPRIVVDRYETRNMRPHRFIVGLDLGKQRDFTALIVNDLHFADRVRIQRTEFEPIEGVVRSRRLAFHRFVQVYRYALGTPYPEINRSVKSVLAQLPLRDLSPELVVDATGVGMPVVDAMRELGVNPLAVTITAGTEINRRASDNYTVPKKILAASLDITLAEDRLEIASGSTHSGTLKAELQNFRVKVSAGGNETMEAWREGMHDDLVLSGALAVWRGETTPATKTGWLTRAELEAMQPGLRLIGEQ